MPEHSLKSICRSWLAAAAVAASLMAPTAANAQVVVVANGSPITELDIHERSKLMATSTHKAPTRQEVIQELIDDRLKIAKAKTYGVEVSNDEVNAAFANMATPSAYFDRNNLRRRSNEPVFRPARLKRA